MGKNTKTKQKEREKCIMQYKHVLVVYLLEWIHSKSYIHPRAVRQEGSKDCLFKYAKDQNLVPEI